jgi:hypothetical protein
MTNQNSSINQKNMRDFVIIVAQYENNLIKPQKQCFGFGKLLKSSDNLTNL